MNLKQRCEQFDDTVEASTSNEYMIQLEQAIGKYSHKVFNPEYN